MNTRWQKIKLVIFLVGSLAAGLGLLSIFGGLSLLRDSDPYYVLIPGSVGGLERGSIVQLRGVTVGTVDDFELYPDDFAGVRVSLDIERGTRLSRNARAFLKYQGLTGLRLIDIEDPTPHAPALPPGSRIDYEATAIEQLTDRAEELVERSIELMTSTEALMRRLATLAERFDAAGVERVLDRTGRVLESADRALVEAGTASQRLAQLIAESGLRVQQTFAGADQVLERTSGALARADRTLATVEQVARDTGSAVQLSERELRLMLSDLRSASRNLKDASREIRDQPSRLLFSSPPPARELP